MQSFLKKVATHIYQNYNSDTSELCVVLPNRRAGLFLKKYLAENYSKPIWAPEIYSIEDFVFELTGLQFIEPIYLQFELYEVYAKLLKEEAKPFAEFINFGQVILKDFNDIDLYMIEPSSIFGYLSESKAMNLWNPDGQPLTNFEKQYLDFYTSLGPVYTELRKILLEKKQVYQGLAYRALVEGLENNQTNIKWKSILFAGFNALTSSEIRILNALKDLGITELVWDADSYYVNNPIQEAGDFLRKNANWLKTKELQWTEDNFSEEEKEINIIGIPKNAGQAKVAGNIIKELKEEGFNPDSTALVLNDEALSIPLLNSLPQEISDFNFTMGLPLKGTPLYKLLNRLLELNDNAAKFNKVSKEGLSFYHVDVARILEHPIIMDIVEHYEGTGFKLSQAESIAKNNQVFLHQADILNSCKVNNILTVEFIDRLFDPWNNNPKKAIANFTFILHAVKETYTARLTGQKGPKLELEYAFHFSKVFNKLKEIFSSVTFLDDLLSFRMVVQQVLQTVSIPFYGEPLKGVQVMGMLETRMLDFENLIMLSVNEDHIPAGKTSQSFIPFEIRREFKLPTYKERNAVFAYHFYRLLQRTKKAYLLYNTEADDLGGGDKSRFITQLVNELPKYNPKIKITEQILTIPPGKINIKPIVISKNKEIITRLDELAVKGFSASSLNIYRSCSLRFYFQYIKKIQEAEEVEETIEASTLGTVIHDVLQNLYKPYEGKILTKEIFDGMRSKSELYIQQSFSEHFQGGNIDHGKNLLIKRVAESYISKFIQKEITELAELHKFNQQITLKSVEERYTKHIRIEGLPDKKQILLKGFVDRIDRVGPITRIIDYKTGNVQQRDLVLKDWDDFTSKPALDKCFQLLFYNYIFPENNDTNSRIQSGIISFRNMNSGFMPVKYPNEEESSNSEFEKLLDQLFSEIYNPITSFSQTEEQANCKYCPYISICSR